jgi:hypothetical protein
LGCLTKRSKGGAGRSTAEDIRAVGQPKRSRGRSKSSETLDIKKQKQNSPLPGIKTAWSAINSIVSTHHRIHPNRHQSRNHLRHMLMPARLDYELNVHILRSLQSKRPLMLHLVHIRARLRYRRRDFR